MGLYGPFTAVAGTMQQCSLDGDAQGIYIRNTSIYDLAIAFKSGQPVNVTSFGGGDWTTIIPAGDRAGIRIPTGIYGASGFPGYVWVLPINNTGSFALTGTSSSNAQFWIETYPDANYLPPDYASAQFINAASQQRVLSVPVAANPATYAPFPFAGSVPGTGTSAILASDPGIGSLAANGASLGYYLYQLIIFLSTGQTAAGSLDAIIQFDLQTAANVSIGWPWPQDLMRVVMSWGVGTVVPPFIYLPPNPLFNPVGLPAGKSIDHSAILLYTAGVNAGGPALLRTTVVYSPDLQNYNKSGGFYAPEPIGHSSSGGAKF